MSNDQTSKAIALGNFSNRNLSHYPEFIEAVFTVKKSAAVANFETGLITLEQRDLILKACARATLDEFVVEPLLGGGGIAVHQNINEVLSRHSGLSKEVINRSQSTSDVGHTAVRMAAIKSFNKCRPQKISDIYSAMVSRWRETKSTARTCLRDAGETTLGNFLSGHSELFIRRCEMLNQSIEKFTVNLGGTVFGSGVGATAEYRERVLEELQKNCDMPFKISKNLYDSAQNSDDLADVSNQFSLMAKAMIKIFQDLRLLFSGPEKGFNQINLKPVMSGSSFFSNKSNPILPETLIQAALVMLGKDHAIQLALTHAELDLNVYDFFMGFQLLDQIELWSKILPLWQQTLESVEVANAST